MMLLAKLGRLVARMSHEKSPPESQMPKPEPAGSSDGPKSSNSRDRSGKEPVGVIDKIIMPRIKRSPPITLQNLPTELLTQIVTLLAPVDRACLAFTSSWLHKLFSNTTKLNGLDRWKFLSRLEQSYMWPSEILCEICMRFHEPRKNRQTFTEKEGRRACIRNDAPSLQRLSISPYLSREIHFDVMAAMSRSNRHNHRALLPGEQSVQFVAPLYISPVRNTCFSSHRGYYFPGEMQAASPARSLKALKLYGGVFRTATNLDRSVGILDGLIYTRSLLVRKRSSNGLEDNGRSATQVYKSLTFLANSYKNVYGLTKKTVG
ncbi:hypothetical protein FMEXI_2827 [Fusarium mexicanum]|uniref:F-box domain-containing protein n=1 Tax=Fusarium mexicanum TaxID=751941 RepID=A0A8H5JGE8_9HYPO|nr:hypothetical protein FMEXI_2827 [Fusarium mexicanum]